MLRTALLVAAVGAALPSCTGADEAARPSRTLDQAAGQTSSAQGTRSPRSAVAERGVELVAPRDLPLLCPVRFPSRGWKGRFLTSERCEYVVDFNAKHPGRLGAFHALAGGRCGEFALRTRRRQWPAKRNRIRDLRLVGTKPLKPGEKEFELVRLRVLRRVRIAGHRGLLLKAAAYPSGGVHGGHIAAVWNQDGAGYAVSLHFEPRRNATPTEKRAAVLRAAKAMSRFTPPSGGLGS